MIKKNLTSSIILVMMLLITPCVSAQTYRFTRRLTGRSKGGQRKLMRELKHS